MPLPPEEFTKRFTYHSPNVSQAQRYQLIRATCKYLAEIIDGNAPDSAEKTLAIRKVEEAAMWANSAIARNE